MYFSLSFLFRFMNGLRRFRSVWLNICQPILLVINVNVILCLLPGCLAVHNYLLIIHLCLRGRCRVCNYISIHNAKFTEVLPILLNSLFFNLGPLPLSIWSYDILCSNTWWALCFTSTSNFKHLRKFLLKSWLMGFSFWFIICSLSGISEWFSGALISILSVIISHIGSCVILRQINITSSLGPCCFPLLMVNFLALISRMRYACNTSQWCVSIT